MTRWTTYRALALGLSLVAPAPSGAGDEPVPARPKARLYTNEDLERVHPFAAETGVSSVPAVSTAPGDGAREARQHGEGRSKRQGESYWRTEAERVRQKLRALDERAAALRARIAERSSRTEVFGRRGSSASSRGTSLVTLQSSLAALETRARHLEEDLFERARRAGALPGWLR
jgi:predicted RNase H-like nuclease (RuvC/YqgF family)